jgi:VWFA-related protein
MMNLKSRFFLLAFCVSLSVHAQQPGGAKAPATGRIDLDVVVAPKAGGPEVNGLQQQDFTVLSNKAAQPITSFKAVDGRQAPTNFILAIDAINTSFQQIAYERGEIEKFLHADSGNLAHPVRVAVITDTNSRFLGGFSSDGNAIATVLDHDEIGLRDIRRSAGFYGATDRLGISLKALGALIATAAPARGRTIIVWMSPGWPILSGPNVTLDTKQEDMIFSSVVGLSTQMRELRVTLYSLNPLGVNEGLARASYYEEFVKGISKPGQAQLGNLSVQVIAEQSGGLALNSSGVSEMLQRVTKDADSFYELSFDAPPAEKPNEYRSIEVKVAGAGLVARTRMGYYAQP